MRQGVWADAETLEHVQSILHCRYEDDLRRHFYNSRVRDLLFSYLVQFGEPAFISGKPSAKEMDAVYLAENIINSDITKHNHIPELSKKVLLNEFRFKSVFKKIFGMGPYEYLIRQRMKKAKELLQAGYSVKEVAAKTGYRLTNFITAFRQYYNYTPGSIQRK